MTMLQVWLSFVLLSSFASAIIQNIPAFSLPEFSFQDLLVLERSTVNDLKKQLTTIGAVQITGIPTFLQARNDAIEDAAVCLTTRKSSISNEEVFQSSMPDGSFRYSIAAKTVDGFRGPMSHKCGESALKLRSLIDSACRQVFAALDSMLPNSETLVMKPNYNTFSELFGKGNNLEHLHAYFPSERKSAVLDTTIDFHLDNGLVIAMTTGYFSDGIPSERSGLYIKLPNGDPVKVVCADSSLILLMGEGSSRWFNRVFENAFRPVPHSLVIDFPPGVANSRTWFGKMYLPPSDAIIPEGNQRYSSYRTEEVFNLSRLPLACEPHKMVNSLACAADELYCWGQCYPASDYSCGMSAQCVNLKTGFVEPGNNMCMDGSYPGGTYCVLECLATPANESSDDGYCYGTGTSMSMTGFVSLATDPKGSTPCINFLFDEWTLDTEVKMAFACLGALALGLIIQFLNLVRAQTRRIDDLFKRKLVKTVLFALQTLLSYFLMLLAMTYSAELFSMTIVGLTLGYALFQPDERAAEISSDPCCPAEEKEYEPLESALLNK